jgi:hypothetical protein
MCCVVGVTPMEGRLLTRVQVLAVVHYGWPDCYTHRTKQHQLLLQWSSGENGGQGFSLACGSMSPGAFVTGWGLPAQFSSAGATCQASPSHHPPQGLHAVPADTTGSSGSVLLCTALGVHVPCSKPLFCDVAVLTQHCAAIDLTLHCASGPSRAAVC